MSEEDEDIYDVVLAHRIKTHYYEKKHSQKYSKTSRRIININYSNYGTRTIRKIQVSCGKGKRAG